MSTPEEHEHAGAQAPSEEEMRAAYEAELARVSTTDMLLQVSVSLINLGARRLGAGGEQGAGDDGRDLEQARDAIDGARALLAILERRIPQELAPLRDALSQLQMAYARELGPRPGAGGEQGGADTPDGGDSGAPGGAGEGDGASSKDSGEAAQQQRGPGPAESSGRLWVPGR